MTETIQDKIIRIEKLKAEVQKTPLTDERGIYSPRGVDAAIRAQAYDECLRILRS